PGPRGALLRPGRPRGPEDAGRLSRHPTRQLQGRDLDRCHRPVSGRPHRGREAPREVPVQVPGGGGREGLRRQTPGAQGRLLTMSVWPGVAAIWSALIAGLASATAYLLVERGRRDLLPFARTTYTAFTVSVLTASAILMTLLLQHRFDVSYV